MEIKTHENKPAIVGRGTNGKYDKLYEAASKVSDGVEYCVEARFDTYEEMQACRNAIYQWRRRHNGGVVIETGVDKFSLIITKKEE